MGGPAKHEHIARRANAQADSLQRAARALEMRREGHNYASIAEALGISKPTVGRLITKGLRAIVREPAEAYLELQRHRLEDMLVALSPGVRKGKVSSIRTALRVVDQLSDLLGLYPEGRSVNVQVNQQTGGVQVVNGNYGALSVDELIQLEALLDKANARAQLPPSEVVSSGPLDSPHDDSGDCGAPEERDGQVPDERVEP